MNKTKLKIAIASILMVIVLTLFSPIIFAVGLLFGPFIAYKTLKHIESDKEIEKKGSINDGQEKNKSNKLLIVKSFAIYALVALLSPLLLIALIIIGPFLLYKSKLKNIQNKVIPDDQRVDQQKNTFFAMNDEEITKYSEKFNTIFQNSQTPFNNLDFTVEKEENEIKYNLKSESNRLITQTITWEDQNNQYIAKIDIKTVSNTTQKEWFSKIKKIQIEKITYQKIEQDIDVSDVKNTLLENQPNKNFDLIDYLKKCFQEIFSILIHNLQIK
jgi:uncharacterized protein YneF (UPF0154 family)